MWKIPLFDLAFDEQEIEAVQNVLRSGWVTMGEITEKFEKSFAEFIGVKYAIAVASGTAALHLTHLALGIGHGDEVICSSFTFVAGANTIVYTGAKPVFADITSYDNFNIAPDDIEAQITARTKALEVVHYAGYPCNMGSIVAIAKKYGLRIIEDCAHALGAHYNGRKCGTLGDIGCFSFFSNKNMTTAEGGMLTTNNDELARKIRLMRSHGMTTLTLDRHQGHAYSYDVVELGYNYRMDEMRSALGMVQLQKLEQNNRRREQLTKYCRDTLQNMDGISLPFLEHSEQSSYHIFPIILDKPINRKTFMEKMKARGIQTSIHYPPIHLFSYYTKRFGYQPGLLPVTESVAQREVTLPLYPALSFKYIDYIADSIQAILRS